jgi:hypothetical protein
MARMINLIAMTRHEANARRAIRERNGGQEVPFYAHPGMYATRAMKQPDGSMRLIVDIPSVEALKAHGAQVINTTEPQSLLDDMFYVSGEIPRVTAFEHGLPTQHRQPSNGGWEPDPLVMDERWVAANVKDKGIVVCSRPARMVPRAKLGFSGTAFHVWRLDTPSGQQHNPLSNCTEGPMDRQEHKVEWLLQLSRLR